MNTPIVPASTVVLLREYGGELQVLLLRRNPELAFAANNWVFPGGKVEIDEIDQSNGDLLAASKLTAVRECLEETQIDIQDLDLIPISHWTTPKQRVKRFATQFFISQIFSLDKVVVDQSEIVEYQWLSAKRALQKHQNKELEIMPPTLVTLSEISHWRRYEQIIAFYTNRELRHYNPKIITHDKNDDNIDISYLYEGDSAYAQSDLTKGCNLNRCEMSDGVIRQVCNID